VLLAFVPDNVQHANGVIIYRGIPLWDDAAELAWDRQEEFGIPLNVICLRNASNHILEIGPVEDFAVT
jgi:hypothetical protein